MNTYRFTEIRQTVENRKLLFPIDVLLVGATGTGKSSTLNSLFEATVAKVGQGVDPETQDISESKLHDYLRFHDSAGLGDGAQEDRRHSKNITSKLLEPCSVGGRKYGFIDLVLVILDGGSRDLGTAFKLLESVVLKSISADRVVVAVNQADMAMKGRYWCRETRKPEKKLNDFLEEQSSSIAARIFESTGCNIPKPIFYSAENGYNIEKLMDHLIAHFPSSRRSIEV